MKKKLKIPGGIFKNMGGDFPSGGFPKTAPEICFNFIIFFK